jgi:acetoin utilization protein AcuB
MLNPTSRNVAPSKAPSARPLVRDFMTATPLTIGRKESLTAARRKMQEAGVRHLPVLEVGRLAGVLSQRDVYMVDTLPGASPDTNIVEDAMSIDVYTVPPDAPLLEVARSMADHKYSCAVVAQGTNVLGVFTTVDAMRALVRSLSANDGPI